MIFQKDKYVLLRVNQTLSTTYYVVNNDHVYIFWSIYIYVLHLECQF